MFIHRMLVMSWVCLGSIAAEAGSSYVSLHGLTREKLPIFASGKQLFDGFAFVGDLEGPAGW